MLIFGWDKIGNDDPGQISLAEAISEKQNLMTEFVEWPLNLKTADFLLRGINRIFLVAFGRNGPRRFPRRPIEVRHYVVESTALVQTPGESGERKRFTFAAHV